MTLATTAINPAVMAVPMRRRKTTMIKLPEHIICEDMLFTLGAIDEKGDGYYLGRENCCIRASDMYIDEEILDEKGIPHYKEYAVNGLYFVYDYTGLLEEYVREMLCSPFCQILTHKMRDFIAKHSTLTERYDFIMEHATKIRNIEQLAKPCREHKMCCMYGDFDCTECMIANYFYDAIMKKRGANNEN